MRILVFVILVLTGNLCYSQTTCDSLKQLKASIYGFKPRDLSDSLKSLKSSELDRFWNIAERNKQEGAECIVQLIKAETKDGYFCFDAASLLLRLDTTEKYLPVVAEGINKCELEDIQLSSFLAMSFYLGKHGIDITPLAIKLLSLPAARVFLSQHFLTLNGIDASLFLIGISPEAAAEEALVNAVKSGNPVARHNASVVLNLLSTHRGDSLLNSVLKSLPDSTVQFIKKDRKNFTTSCKGTRSRNEIIALLKEREYNFEKGFYGFAGNRNLICSAIKELLKEDILLVRDARSRSVRGLSDESLHEYFALTRILISLRVKHEKPY